MLKTESGLSRPPTRRVALCGSYTSPRARKEIRYVPGLDPGPQSNNVPARRPGTGSGVASDYTPPPSLNSPLSPPSNLANPRQNLRKTAMTFKAFTLASLLALSASASAQTDVDTPPSFDGVWQNERGSFVELIAKDGVVSGQYKTNVGQPDASMAFPLLGFIEGDQITFTVNFKGYGSMTSWTGQMTETDGEDEIRTLWNLTRNVPDAVEDDDMWGSITSGASNFRRVETVEAD